MEVKLRGKVKEILRDRYNFIFVLKTKNNEFIIKKFLKEFEYPPNIAVGEAVIVKGRLFGSDYYNGNKRETIKCSSIEVIKPQKKLNDFLKNEI